MCVCVRACVPVHCVSISLRRPEVDVGCFFCLSSPSIEGKDLSENPELVDLTSLVSHLVWELLCLPDVLRLKTGDHTHLEFTRMPINIGLELQSIYSCGKHLTQRAISLAPSFIYF